MLRRDAQKIAEEDASHCDFRARKRFIQRFLSVTFIQSLENGSESVNIQIFGTRKCNDTKKAQRFFKERGIKFQFVDITDKGMSKGELKSVAQANGGIDNMINPDAKDKDTLALIRYIADEDKMDKLLENQQIIKTPIVRNGKQSTLGYQPDIWKKWA